MFRGLTEALTLARSGIIDREYYQAQTGTTFGNDLSVARHYLGQGAADGCSVHPLFEPTLLDPKLPYPSEAGSVILRYLDHPEQFGKSSPHPAFDLGLARRALREAGVGSREGVWLAWVKWARPSTPVPLRDATAPVAWSALRAAVLRAAADWRAADASAAVPGGPARPRQPGRTSIVVAIGADAKSALARLSLLKDAGDRELVATGFTSRALYCSFAALAEARPIVVARAKEPNLARQWNLGAAAATGDRLVFVAPHASLSSPAVAELVAVLAEPSVAVVQPLNETPAMTIASAGAYFGPGAAAPAPLLREHPTADADRAGNALVPAALSGIVGLRREAFERLGGFDEGFGNMLAEVDLSLRAGETGTGSTMVVPSARATLKRLPAHYASDLNTSSARLRERHPNPPADAAAGYLRAAGFVVVGQRENETGFASPILGRPAVGRDALPRLRWTIDTPVTAGWWAQIWGDWHFANSLARALRRLGQDVAVDTRQARERATRELDDVLLTIRGKEAVPAAPGRVNLLWIISHPDDVTPAELAGYDRVFAASVPWAAKRSTQWGVPIEPLLQCTDAELFHPGRALEPANERALFVGNYRPDRVRPVVSAALASGIDLDLYGTGWDDLPAAVGRTKAQRVDNAELGRLYAEAGVVLNDHWDDMRESGFISNRLFDAVACGARVLSDSVVAAADLFGDCVRFCETDAEAARLLKEPLDGNWPGLDERRELAERVRLLHSFDERARVLLEAATGAISTNSGPI